MIALLFTIMRCLPPHETWFLGGWLVGLIISNAHRFENSLIVSLVVVLVFGSSVLNSSLWGYDAPVPPM